LQTLLAPCFTEDPAARPTAARMVQLVDGVIAEGILPVNSPERAPAAASRYVAATTDSLCCLLLLIYTIVSLLR
jgi:hypothetical protein